jgi:hypothetical protein
MESDTQVLEWHVIKESARICFSIYGDLGEMDWAQQAWDHIVQHGLANYANRLERSRCIICLLSLEGLYEDFCELAWNESANLDYTTYTDGLNLSVFHIGQLVGPDITWPEAGNDIYDLYQPIKYLADKRRREVSAALVQGFGGDNALFYSLISTKQSGVFEQWPSNWQEIADRDEYWSHRLQMPRDENKLMDWIMRGCQPYASTDRDP